jgi:uncharacterized protein YodC (DUF2158 family)
MQPLLPRQIAINGGANLASLSGIGGGGMAFKVGDVVRLKCGGARMIVSKLFKSPDGREMVQRTWSDKKPREHRAAFVIDSLEVAEQATLRTRPGECA